MKTLKGKNYYALLCHCGSKGYWDALICGVYANKGEAQRENEKIDVCSAKHTIKKCDIEIKV